MIQEQLATPEVRRMVHSLGQSGFSLSPSLTSNLRVAIEQAMNESDSSRSLAGASTGRAGSS